METLYCVPVFVGSTGIEVKMYHCEKMARGQNWVKHCWLRSVFLSLACVSAQLIAGGTDGQVDWREELTAK